MHETMTPEQVNAATDTWWSRGLTLALARSRAAETGVRQQVRQVTVHPPLRSGCGATLRRAWRFRDVVAEPCACWPVTDPWTYYGITEPGGAMEPNPHCPTHGAAETKLAEPCS